MESFVLFTHVYNTVVCIFLLIKRCQVITKVRWFIDSFIGTLQLTYICLRILSQSNDSFSDLFIYYIDLIYISGNSALSERNHEVACYSLV